MPSNGKLLQPSFSMIFYDDNSKNFGKKIFLKAVPQAENLWNEPKVSIKSIYL